MELSSETARQTCQGRSGPGAAILGLVLAVGAIRAQNNPDQTAIRQILDSEVTTWNKGAQRLRRGRSNPRVRPFSPWAAEITIPT